MFLGNSYLPAIQELKRGGNVIIVDTPKAYFMASRLVNAGVAKWHHVPDLELGSLHMLLPIKQTKPTEVPTPSVIDRVHVSFWQQGERKGKFSSGAYDVVPTEKPRDGFVTIQLTTDKQLTVKTEYTKAVA